MSAPVFYYPNVDDVQVHKAWALAQQAVLMASTVVGSLEQVNKAKALAKQAFSAGWDDPKIWNDPSFYNSTNHHILDDFDHAFRGLADIDLINGGPVNFKLMREVNSAALLALQGLNPPEYLHFSLQKYDPIAISAADASSSTRKHKKGPARGSQHQHRDWRDGLWIDERDETNLRVYALEGSDRRERHFNEDNVRVVWDGSVWTIADDEGVRNGIRGERGWGHGEWLYPDVLRQKYGMPVYSENQQKVLNQYLAKEAQKDAMRRQGIPNFLEEFAAQQQGHQAGPSWQPYPGQGPGPSWPPYTGQGRRRYKSRRVKIPRQRRKTNRKNKTIRKK